ncbi:MAG: enoyl-CoA hydratase-related protein [Burkholderiaceae bacterium]
MNQDSPLKLQSEGGIAELTLSRPEQLNTLGPQFWAELPAVIERLDSEGQTRVLILSSTGKHFTAGMELSMLADGFSETTTARGREQLQRKALHLQAVFNSLEKSRFPVIAAIQGGCVGGGLDMVCACDLRYATKDAFFCIQEINVGLMADLGTLQRLPKLLPEAVVRELAYTGERLDAQEAHRLGFVNHVFEDHAALLAAARKTAARIASKSALAIAGSKETITFSRDYPVAVGLHMAATWQAGMLDTAEVAALARAPRGSEAPPTEPLAPRPKAL